MRVAGIVLGAIIVVGVVASYVLRRLGLRIEAPVRVATAIVTRTTIALFTGIAAVEAAERGGWFFWSLAALLAVLSAFSAILAAAMCWLLVSGASTSDDADAYGRAWQAKRDGDVTVLVRLMQDRQEESGARSFAARLLGRLKNPLAIEPLTAALDDEDEDVRRAAGDALRRLGHPPEA